MTDPNVLGGDKYGLKFLFDSGNTRIVHLGRPYTAGNWPNTNPLSLNIMDSGLTGSGQYVVPVGKKFLMFEFWIKQEGTTDLSLSIQRNSTPDNDVLGDNLFQMIIDNAEPLPIALTSIIPGGLQFNAGDYVTPYMLGSTPRWVFWCWGVECDA